MVLRRSSISKKSPISLEVIKVCGGIGSRGVVVTAAQTYSSAISYIGRRVSAKDVHWSAQVVCYAAISGTWLTYIKLKRRCLSAAISTRLSSRI